MDFVKNSKRDSMIAFITATATADSEDDVQSLLKVFNPVDSRSKMGNIYEDVLGYNPITHFDMKDIIAAADDVLNNASLSDRGMRILRDDKEAIAKKAMKIFEDRRDDHLREALAIALQDFLSPDDATACSYFLIGAPTPVQDLDDEDDDDESIGSALDDGDDLTDTDDLPKIDDDDDEDFGFDSEDEGDDF